MKDENKKFFWIDGTHGQHMFTMRQKQCTLLFHSYHITVSSLRMDTDIFQDLNGFLQLPDDTQNPFSPITRVYNQQELATINEFKNDYMEAATPAARKTICQFKIFPAIFNYWASIGEVIDEENKVSRSKVSSV